MLKGDIVVSLYRNSQEADFTRISVINEFKKIQFLNFNKEISVLEMAFEPKCEGLDEYDGVINLLNSTSYPSFHEFAEGLKFHKNRMNLLKQA